MSLSAVFGIGAADIISLGLKRTELFLALLSVLLECGASAGPAEFTEHQASFLLLSSFVARTLGVRVRAGR